VTDDYRKAFYDAYATTHTIPRKGEVTSARLRHLSRHWHARFRPLLPTDRMARILDVGCGDGTLLLWLQQCGYRNAAGVEISAEQVAIAHQLGAERVTLAPLDAFLARQRDAWDVLVLRNVLEHFPKAEALQVLRLAHSALAPGGRIVLQVPNGQSPFAGRIRYGDFTHELAFTERSLAQVLAVIGFGAIRCRPVTPVFGGLLGPVRAVAWRAVELLYRSLLAAEVGAWPAVVTLDVIATAVRPQ
jgi:2-polyprenyl-3-methyl-5-hydroxy-6-metoxy-1,4-benzoquinol methylase